MFKKKFAFLLVFAMILSLVTNVSVFADELLLNEANENEFIQEYKGVEQDIRLNSVPIELQRNTPISDAHVDVDNDLHIDENTGYDIRLNSAPPNFFDSKGERTDESVNLNSNSKDFSEIKEKYTTMRGMPTGGGEYPYQPSFWNDPANIYRANCYGYMLNRIASDTSDPYAGYLFQPGYRTGNYYTSLTKTAIIKAVKSDMADLGRTIRSSSYSEVPGPNEYKVALVIASNDYHWYRQDSDGGWSHKPGLTELTYKDASGHYISDPRTCDRNYSYANYSTWGGYYIVSR